MKAIETRYAGCRFRSRLEARWAVFFDHLGIEWEYEPQGFEIPKDWDEHGATWRYLPDFWLPRLSTFVEVKGTDTQATDDYKRMLACGVDWGGPLASGLLCLGSIPDVSRPVTFVGHAYLRHRKGVELDYVNFGAFGNLRRDVTMFLPTDCTTAPDFPKAASWEPQPLTVTNGSGWTYGMSPYVKAAYEAARSARFEHGQVGAQ